MMNKNKKFPYDYKSYALKSGKGSATFIGTPTPEMIEAVNALAEAAAKMLNAVLNDKPSVATGDASSNQS
jgi:hypothetical protein